MAGVSPLLSVWGGVALRLLSGTALRLFVAGFSLLFSVGAAFFLRVECEAMFEEHCRMEEF